MRVAIVQSSYIPWKGYFDLIAAVDHFVLFDEVQYTRRDWRNRNRIRTADGARWLTIPVQTKGAYTQRIDETRIADPGWARSHWSVLRQAYATAACRDEATALLEPLYASFADDLLSEVNERLLRRICAHLDITTPITRSTDHPGGGRRSTRLLGICQDLGATEYVSGPAAQTYLDVDLFANEGIDVHWFEYDAALEPLSIVDTLFCAGRSVRA